MCVLSSGMLYSTTLIIENSKLLNSNTLFLLTLSFYICQYFYTFSILCYICSLTISHMYILKTVTPPSLIFTWFLHSSYLHRINSYIHDFGLACECFSLTKVIYAAIQLELSTGQSWKQKIALTGTMFSKLVMRKMQEQMSHAFLYAWL